MQFKTWDWDRILFFICLGLILFVIVKGCNEKEPKNYDGYIQEFNQEIEQVKKDVQNINDNLQKEYERIDSADKPDLHIILDDYFRSRK